MHLRLSRSFIRRRVLTKFYEYFSFSPCLLKSLHLMILSVLCIFLLSVCLILYFLCTVVPLPPGTNPFVVNNSNSNNNNNNNNNKRRTSGMSVVCLFLLLFSLLSPPNTLLGTCFLLLQCVFSYSEKSNFSRTCSR